MLGSWREMLIGLVLVLMFLSVGFGLKTKDLHRDSSSAPELKIPIKGYHSLTLPSKIVNLYIAAHRQWLQDVDLRRAEYRLAQSQDAEPTTKPLMDKVLVVPKHFSNRGE